MNTAQVDRKLRVLYENYRDRAVVSEAQAEVESIRRRALARGVTASAFFLFLNEASRLTLRSPLLRLTSLNLVMICAGPVVVSRYLAHPETEERIANLWRIHCNRVDKGLGGTYQPNGYYDDKAVDMQYKHPAHSFDVPFEELLHGRKYETQLDDPFTRFNKDIEEFPMFHQD